MPGGKDINNGLTEVIAGERQSGKDHKISLEFNVLHWKATEGQTVQKLKE